MNVFKRVTRTMLYKRHKTGPTAHQLRIIEIAREMRAADPDVSHEAIAAAVGLARSRVSFILRKHDG
jgi:hypothetical protein